MTAVNSLGIADGRIIDFESHCRMRQCRTDVTFRHGHVS